MTAVRSSLEELVFLHKQFLQGRILFRSVRSINRLHQAVDKFVNLLGNVAAAKQAVRLNLVGKAIPFKSLAFSFACDKIRSFESAKQIALRKADSKAKKMALKVYYGSIT